MPTVPARLTAGLIYVLERLRSAVWPKATCRMEAEVPVCLGKRLPCRIGRRRWAYRIATEPWLPGRSSGRGAVGTEHSVIGGGLVPVLRESLARSKPLSCVSQAHCRKQRWNVSVGWKRPKFRSRPLRPRLRPFRPQRWASRLPESGHCRSKTFVALISRSSASMSAPAARAMTGDVLLIMPLPGCVPRHEIRRRAW